MGGDSYQISHRRCDDSSLDLTQIARTTRRSSMASGPGSGPGSVRADAGDARTIVSMSMDMPRHPAFWRFTGVGVDGGGSGVFGVYRRAFAAKSRRALLTPTVSLPATLGVDVVVAEREAREDVDVREVVVPCERMEERSETEVRAEAERERSHGGHGFGVETAAAGGGTGGGGGTRRVFVREREEAACGRCACEEWGAYAGGDGRGCRALRGETAHSAPRLGNQTLGKLGRMR